MKNPYYIDEPCGLSFSGGRTSAYMLYKTIDAHDGKLPKNLTVSFCNTGKEMPETLDFVKKCGDEWGVDIRWIEIAKATVIQMEPKKKIKWEFKEVNRDTCSVNGEPFEITCSAIGSLPGPVHRSCSGHMKQRLIMRLMLSEGYEKPWTQYVGIRADEERRAAKLNGRINDGAEIYLPLWLDGVTKEEVGNFWELNSFDLSLPNNDGVTDWGNCDLCFLKSKKKKISIIKQRPDLADWWIGMEDKYGEFRRGEIGYRRLKEMATDNYEMDFGIDESIPCFCGD